MLSYASLSLFQLLKKKESKRKKRMHPLSGFSHPIWLSENVTVLILVSAALFECCLRLSDWTNKLSLPYVNKCRFFFFFPLCYRESKCSTFSLSFSLFSDCSWCWALPSTAMIPPNIAACMRNEKLGEACFYLMGHNQTTVCSSINTRCFCAVA